MIETGKIYCESNLDTLARMPDGFIDMTLTSPPYDDLRTYNGYSWDFEALAKELFRVTKQGGVVVWVVGDATVDGSETGTSFRQALYFKEIGFNLHDTMIYQKQGFRYPDAIRYNPTFEYMFVFSKGPVGTFNPLKDKRNAWAGGNVARASQNRDKDGCLSPNSAWKTNPSKIVAAYGKRDAVWSYAIGGGKTFADTMASSHPAAFPEQLAKDHILSWSNENDIVYDCFMGSGTTAKAAHQLKRRWIGSEISQEYVDLANKRLEPYLAQESLFG